MKQYLCCHVGCVKFRVPGSRYCEKHREADEAKDRQRYVDFLSRKYNREHTTSRAGSFYSSSDWKKLSKRLLNERKYCEFCGEYATDVHHIRPVADFPELALDEDNLIVLCKACHARETERERKERKGR